MKYINGVKVGGLQQRIFNLMLIFLFALVAGFIAVSVYQQSNLASIVGEASAKQQEAISAVSEETMESMLDVSLSRMTALQAYIAGDLFGDVRSDVLVLQAYATNLFRHAGTLPDHPFYPPDKVNDGVASVQMQHEAGVDPYESETLGLIANMSEVMLSMFTASDKLSSCFIATADGNILFVDDRAGSYFDENGQVYDFEVRSRPWYQKAVDAGDIIFTGLEADAFTDILGLVCAAPVYQDGELVAVVGADIFLTSIREYVESVSSDDGFVCVISEDGQVLFSPKTEGIFRAELSKEAPDLRESGNAELARFISEALSENTGLKTLTIDGKEYYATGAPMETVGWAAISVVDKAKTHRPTDVMLENYDSINEEALGMYADGVRKGTWTFIVLTGFLVLLAVMAATMVSGRIVKPIEHMTKQINELSGNEQTFQMHPIYRTKDEIELMAESFTSLSQKTKEYIHEITSITAEKERIGAELSLATRIQADMLPNIFPAFPERSEFDIYASMDPAREVGGDFYDFFLVDPDHLCMLIADVSGKGVPAALFMMASRIILASNAKLGKSPAEILRATNETICQNNREEMFVTVWLGILEISTGKLTAANAGHEYPAVMHKDGDFELFKDKHGFVIGGMDGVRYRDYEIQMEEGSKLFVYTDGVPEATSAKQELFGTDRMLRTLNENKTNDPEMLLKNMRRAVDAFVEEAEQFDDLTMLGFEYKGAGDMNYELKVAASDEKLPVVASFVDGHLEKAGCSSKVMMQIALAVEEVFVNIAHYAYEGKEGEAIVKVALSDEPKEVVITFLDRGKPFDPTAKDEPDVTLAAEERSIGGLGIFLARKIMDEVSYERTDGMNILRLTKKL